VDTNPIEDIKEQQLHSVDEEAVRQSFNLRGDVREVMQHPK
jgi:hypothetical protein